MPRYFFDLSDSCLQFPDKKGTELHCIDDAKDEAVRALVDIIRILPDGAYRELAYTVRDDSGRQLMQVAIKFELQPVQG
ncbi:hypothetical protein D3227_06045 [Mesorhizobium waimense]|uniref:DUF6894 domain-containing protein n=1 Tax=Mesorhizobium waimense TaxID=1300307 RepID=A0A3A5L416_9HYPH|nr:hypothetical protein D3227_06045 [Mesorhizobium waimense]